METQMVVTTEQILIVDTVTKLGPEAVGNVVIAGSHGCVYAGFEAARAGVRGVILHDAGVGLDDAGIGSLSYLEDLGIAAATIDASTAIIGNGDSLANDGITSFINETAAKLGCAPGQPAMDCALAMRAASGSSGDVPLYEEARFLIRDGAGGAIVRGCDSAPATRGVSRANSMKLP